MKSRVHPTYKARYRVTHWRESEQGLVRRGDVTIWLSPMAGEARKAQAKLSDLAIEAALTLGLAFHLPLRQSESSLRSVLKLKGVNLDVPDHTTISRRSSSLRVSLGPRTSEGPIDLIIDSSGLGVVGEDEWAAAKHGGRAAGAGRSSTLAWTPAARSWLRC